MKEFFDQYRVKYLGRDARKNIIYFTYNDALWSLPHNWGTKVFQRIGEELRHYFKADTWELRGIPDNRQEYIRFIIQTKHLDTTTNPYESVLQSCIQS